MTAYSNSMKSQVSATPSAFLFFLLFSFYPREKKIGCLASYDMSHFSSVLHSVVSVIAFFLFLSIVELQVILRCVNTKCVIGICTVV